MSFLLNVVTAEGRQLPVHVDGSDTLGAVRAKIYSTHGFSLHDRDLYFNAVRYSDTYDLATIGAAFQGAILGASVIKNNGGTSSLSVNVNAPPTFNATMNNMITPVSPPMGVPVNVTVNVMSSPATSQQFRRFSDNQSTQPQQQPVMSVPLTPVTPTMLPLTLSTNNLQTPVMISPSGMPEARRFSETTGAPVFYRTSITQPGMFPTSSSPTTSISTSSPSYSNSPFMMVSPSSTPSHHMMNQSPTSSTPSATPSNSNPTSTPNITSPGIHDKRPSFKRLQSNNPFEQVEATLELAASHPINDKLFDKPDSPTEPVQPPTPETRLKSLLHRSSTISTTPSSTSHTSPGHSRNSSNMSNTSSGLPPRRHKKGLSVAFDIALNAYETDKLATETEIATLTTKLKELHHQSDEIKKNHTEDVETMEEQVKKLRVELATTVTERELAMAKYKHDIADLQHQHNIATQELQREQTRSKEIISNASTQQNEWEMKITSVNQSLIRAQEETRSEKTKQEEIINALTSKYATLSCKRDTEHWEKEQYKQKLLFSIYNILHDHGMVQDVKQYLEHRHNRDRETKETDITVIENNLQQKINQSLSPTNNTSS